MITLVKYADVSLKNWILNIRGEEIYNIIVESVDRGVFKGLTTQHICWNKNITWYFYILI